MAKGFLGIVTFILVIVGALNWGLVGAFNVDLVQLIFGSLPMIAKIIYVLVGISAIVQIIVASNKNCCR